MAGAGKKTFVAGEVLTAAQVNDYLMDQAVMRFSGSAARAASITAPTEGMVTYLDDQNRLEIYDGSAWIIADPRELITASGQLLVGAGTGSLAAIDLGAENTVLTRNSASPYGLGWQAISGGAKASYSQVASLSTNTALQATLTPGFYRIQLSNTSTYTSAQFRFVDSDGNFYGATVTSGAGFFTIPVTVASLNVTTGTVPFNVLVEEIKGVTESLLPEPTITSFDWTTISGGKIIFTPDPGAASVGSFDRTTGSFYNLGAAAPGSSGEVNIVTGSAWAPASLNSSANFLMVHADPNGIWSAAASAETTGYPFKLFTTSGTYVPPPWSASADALIVSGGGGGGFAESSGTAGGAGGAGGASVFTDIATGASVAVTIGNGGPGGATAGTSGTQGSSSSFASFSTTGGGGGAWVRRNPSLQFGTGQPGGSGGGGSSYSGLFDPTSNDSAGGAGIAGQGNTGGRGWAWPGPGQSGGGGGAGGQGGGTPGEGSTPGAAGVVWGQAHAAGGAGVPDGGSPVNGAAGTAGTGNGGNGSTQGAAGGTGGSGLVLVKAK